MEMSAKNKDTIVDEEDNRVSCLETLIRSGLITIEFANGMLESEAFGFTDQERVRVMQKLKKLGKSAAKNPKRSSEEDVKEVLIGCMRDLGSEATECLKEGMNVSDDIWAAAMTEYATGIPDPQKPASSSLTQLVTMESITSQEMDATIEDVFEKKLNEVSGILVNTVREEVYSRLHEGFEKQNQLIQGSIKSHIDDGTFKTILREVCLKITEAMSMAFGEDLTPLINEALKSELRDSSYDKQLLSIHDLQKVLEEVTRYQVTLTTTYMDPELRVFLSRIPPCQGYLLLKLQKLVSDSPYWSTENLTEIASLIDSVHDNDPFVVLCGRPIFNEVYNRLIEILFAPGGGTQNAIIHPIFEKLGKLANFLPDCPEFGFA